MHILLVKLSSMGDVLHALPAVSDACTMVPGVRFDWVVEEGFTDIPSWHPGVDRVLRVATRRWRGNPWASRGEMGSLRRELAVRQYDLVLDSQGLMKSAVIAWLARGRVAGFDRVSAREPAAVFAYNDAYTVERGRHAIDRQRSLFAQALGYEVPGSEVDYRLDTSRMADPGVSPGRPYLVFLHGTTWPSKRWPISAWRTAAEAAADDGYTVLLPSADELEAQTARSVAAELPNATVLPSLTLSEISTVIAGAAGVIAVDTGLGHMAAALGVPCISIYGSTSPDLTGTRGDNQLHTRVAYGCAPCLSRRCGKIAGPDDEPPCYETVPAQQVWSTLRKLITAGPGVQAGQAEE